MMTSSNDLQARLSEGRKRPYWTRCPYTPGQKARLHGGWYLTPSGGSGLPLLRGPGGGAIKLIELSCPEALNLARSILDCYGLTKENL